LTAVAGERHATVYQGTRRLAEKATPLAPRRLDTRWVIGQQGNIDGEYWHGEIAELLVYDRELPPEDLDHAWRYLDARHAVATQPAPLDPRFLALASLCHVLFNSNEFIYVD